MQKQNIIIDSNDIGLAQENIQNQLRLRIDNVWGELITNIPVTASVCDWYIQIDKDNKLIKVRYTQDAFGPNPSVFKFNLASTTHKNLEYVEDKKVDSSSCYGTGLYGISKLSKDLKLKFTSRTIDGDVWSYTYGGKNPIIYDTKLESSVGVEIEFDLEYTRTFGSYKDLILKLHQMLKDIDNKNILGGRDHRFHVTGIKGTDGQEVNNNSKQLEGHKWVYKLGDKKVSTPEHNGLVDEDGITHSEIVMKDVVTQIGDSISATLYNITVGKVDKDTIKLIPNNKGDLMLVVVYYKGTNQIAFVKQMRLKGKQVSLNNVVVTCEMDRSEIAQFLTSTQKLDGCNKHLFNAIKDKLNQFIWNVYPDTKLIEDMVQSYTEELIFKKGHLGDLFRAKSNLVQLTKDKCWDWSTELKRDVVRREKKIDDSRYDITVYQYWETNGKVDKSKTPYTVIENKRKDFKPQAVNQSTTYVTKNKMIVNIVAVSSGITENNEQKWENNWSEVRTARRLIDVDDITTGIIDVDEFDFLDNDKQKALRERCIKNNEE